MLACVEINGVEKELALLQRPVFNGKGTGPFLYIHLGFFLHLVAINLNITCLCATDLNNFTFFVCKNRVTSSNSFQGID